MYNIGGAQKLSINQIARVASEAAGVGPASHQPFPEEIQTIDIGRYYTNSDRAARALGWCAQVKFAEGIRLTLDYYRRELGHYLDPAHPEPARRMPEHAGRERRLKYADVR